MNEHLQKSLKQLKPGMSHLDAPHKEPKKVGSKATANKKKNLKKDFSPVSNTTSIKAMQKKLNDVISPSSSKPEDDETGQREYDELLANDESIS